MKRFIKYFFALSLFFASCASTSVQYEASKPATLDLEKVKTISILPIKPLEQNKIVYHEAFSNKFSLLSEVFYFFYEYKPKQEESLNFLEKEIISNIKSSSYLSFVDSAAVQESLQNKTENPAELYITCEVTDFNVDDQSRLERIMEKDTEENRFCRNVKMTIKYNIIDGKTNKTLLSDSYTMQSVSKETDSRLALKDVFDIQKNQLKICATKIIENLQPHKNIESIELLKIKTNNKTIKQADSLAKKNRLEESSAMFFEAYTETLIFEAGYNAAVLQQALGNLEVAEKQMQVLYEKTKDERALNALQNIRQEIKSSKKFTEQVKKFK